MCGSMIVTSLRDFAASFACISLGVGNLLASQVKYLQENE